TTRPCASVCGAGEEVCAEGTFAACDAPAPDADGRCPGAPGCDEASRLPRGASRLTGNEVDARFPKPVWTGAGWAVFWGQSQGIDGDVWLALRDADGRPAGAPRVVLDRHFADAVWLGDAFFVAGVEGGQVAFARPAADGARGLVTEPFLLPTGSFSEGQLAVGPAGIGVAWSDGLESVWFMRLDRDARELAAPVQVAEAPGRQHDPSLVADANGFTVAWKDDRADPDGNGAPAVYVRQLTVDGTPRGPARRIAGGTSPSLARLAVGGYLLAFVDHRDGRNDDVYVTPLTSAGERAGPDVLLSDSPANARAPSVAALGAGAAVAWHDRRQDPADAIRVARLDAQGNPVGGVEAVTDGAAPAIHPALTVGEADRLAVSWMDRRHTDEAFGPAAAYAVVGPLLCPEE
ncbi:MAG: hypothetical protein KC613_23290, partial [Myxococcales bacterium]|nr:hypothetical protein [Myxococcales bacterium]